MQYVIEDFIRAEMFVPLVYHRRDVIAVIGSAAS
jgi:hypothetical protein